MAHAGVFRRHFGLFRCFLENCSLINALGEELAAFFAARYMAAWQIIIA